MLRLRTDNNDNYRYYPKWAYPAIYLLFSWAMSGALGIVSLAANEDSPFRSSLAALTLPLLTSVLWYAISATERRTKTTIMGVLLAQHRLAEFASCRRHFEDLMLRGLALSAVVTLIISLITVMMYLDINTLSGLSLWALTIIELPFWFALTLFVLQMGIVIRVLYRQLLVSHRAHHDKTLLTPINALVVRNVTSVSIVFSLLGLLWLGSVIQLHVSLVVFSLAVIGFAVVLYPAYRLQRILSPFSFNYGRREGDSAKLAEGFVVTPFTRRQSLNIVFSMALLPFSWYLFACIVI